MFKIENKHLGETKMEIVEIIGCPYCDAECGRISKTDIRVVTFTMRHLHNDIFECEHCLSTFEVSLNFRPADTDIVDIQFVKDEPLLREQNSP
jgi:uncharacterized protein with PIN domain